MVLSSTSGYIISPNDLPLSSVTPTPANYSPIVTNPVPNGTYTLRQLVYYYDNYYTSTNPFVIDLGNQTYNFNSPDPGDNFDLGGDLDVYLGGSYGSIGPLQIQNGTVNANYEDRAFQVLQGRVVGVEQCDHRTRSSHR